jgi:tRNA (guanine-N7-)-methyltransferase
VPGQDTGTGDRGGAFLRSFGRRRARKLTDRQQALLDDELSGMALDVTTPPRGGLGSLFARPMKACWLEIGFGGGEHLLWQAAHNPDVGFIACEPFIDGVVKVVDGAVTGGLDNIRIHADDARDVLPWLPEASIERAFILFPDPWPKARHHKRRLVEPRLLAALARVMVPGGELRLATDIDDYARQMLLAAKREGSFAWQASRPADWRERPADWPETRYEQKAIRESRKRYFLRFRRTG